MGDLTQDQAALPTYLTDGTAAIEASVQTTAPVGTEGALVTRNIPSGTQDTNVASVGGTTVTAISLGQATSAASTPVVIASDQSDVSVTDDTSRRLMEQSIILQMQSNIIALMSEERDGAPNRGFDTRLELR